MTTPADQPRKFLGKLVIAGPSGVGKSTIIQRVLDANRAWMYSISATTRPLRPGEREGWHYWHVSRDEFHNRIEAGGFLEYAFVFGNYYGTPRSELGRAETENKHLLIEIDTVGSFSIRAVEPDIPLVAIIPPSLVELERRLTSRGTDSPEQLRERKANVFAELQRMRRFDFVVVNDDVDKAVERLLSIMQIIEDGLHDVAATLDHVLLRREE